MKIVAFDPGVSTGWALFKDKLVACGLITWDGWNAEAPEFREAWFATVEEFAPNRVAVVELPQVYRASQSKGDPADLIDTAFRAGMLASWVQPWCAIKTVMPREWKGQLPKEVHHRRILAALTPEERAVLDACEAPRAKMHNVIDAVGLGLWQQGRMK